MDFNDGIVQMPLADTTYCRQSTRSISWPLPLETTELMELTSFFFPQIFIIILIGILRDNRFGCSRNELVISLSSDVFGIIFSLMVQSLMPEQVRTDLAMLYAFFFKYRWLTIVLFRSHHHNPFTIPKPYDQTHRFFNDLNEWVAQLMGKLWNRCS